MTQSTPDKYEMRTVGQWEWPVAAVDEFPEAITKSLNTHAQEGWLLHNINRTRGQMALIFRRQREDSLPAEHARLQEEHTTLKDRYEAVWRAWGYLRHKLLFSFNWTSTERCQVEMAYREAEPYLPNTGPTLEDRKAEVEKWVRIGKETLTRFQQEYGDEWVLYDDGKLVQKP